jgi:hypothetical protein
MLNVQAIGAMDCQSDADDSANTDTAAAADAAAIPQPPASLRCPITQLLLVDPVILVDSAQTYDRAAIQEWLDRGNKKDPVTGVCWLPGCGQAAHGCGVCVFWGGGGLRLELSATHTYGRAAIKV